MNIPLGPFLLHEPLGRGGMGAVWRGEHLHQRLPVAVKVMVGHEAREPRYRTAFRREVQAVAGLDHDGVVIVFEHGESTAETEAASGGRIRAGSPYLAMELASGTLREVRHGLTWPRLQTVLLSLLDALAHAHARGVIHRDLKPSNVLAFGAASSFPAGFKLADFGLAEVGRAAHDEREAVSGTPRYMAPEQILGRWRDDGPWTDLYSFGCLAWELISGAPPFVQAGTRALVEAHLRQAPPALRPRAPVPEGTEAWLRRLLMKDPRERFPLAADAALALKDLGFPAEGGEYGILESAEQPTGPVTDDERTERDLLEPPAAISPSTPPPLGARPVPPLPESWRRPASADRAPVLLGAGLGLWGLRPVPFVGREAERDRLWDELAEVRRRGRVRVVLLHGPAGTGKSRLAEWIAERAHEAGAAISLEAVHSPMATPAEGLPRMLGRALRCQGLQGPELLQRTQQVLRAQGVEDPAEWEGLARLMGRGEEATTSAAQSLAERHGLITRLLRRMTRERPAIVRLDDVQWGREALAFCRSLLREDDALPALVLLTVRDEALAARPDEAALLETVLGEEGASRLEVAPLPAADHHRLVERLLGLEHELVRRVEERTEGNPLFAVQLVGDWVQRGVLEVGTQGFALRAGETAPLPEDLHQVWAGHVRALLSGRPASFRTSLEIAAALGHAVDRAEWEQACRAAGSEPPAGLVDALVRRRLARRSELGWSFVHAMLPESLERLAREGGAWSSHHLACAHVLRPRYERGERGAAERLALHLLQAQRPAEAVDPLLQAAAERRETSDYARAHALLEKREEALQAAALPESDARRGEGWVLRARVFLHEGRLDEVFTWAERAERAAQTHGWTRALSESLRLQGDAARRRGELDRAASLYERCVALLHRLDNPHGVAASLWGLGDVHRQRGRLDEALHCFRRSRDLYEKIDDRHGVADHAIGEADVAWQRGELLAAQNQYGRALDLFRALGNRYGVARALNGLGEVSRAEGDLDAARGRYQEALALLELVQSADAVFPRVNLGLLALAEQRWDEARAQLEPVTDELRTLGWSGLLAGVQAALLACDAERRDWDAWDGRLREVLSATEQRALEPDLAWAAGLAADLAAEAGEASRAREASAIASAQWRGLGRGETAPQRHRDTENG